MAAVVIVWPQPEGDWAANYAAVEACYWQMLEATAQHSPVWLLRHPSLAVGDFLDRLAGINSEHAIEVISDIEYDDTWVRDFGPLSKSGELISFEFNGWGGKYTAIKDNAVAKALGQKKNLKLRAIDFVCEGGALEVNEAGVLMVNTECVVDEHRNPGVGRQAVEQLLKDTLGVSDVAWVEGICVTGDDTDGHIDTIARFAPGGKVVYSGRNEQHHDAAVLQSLHQQLARLANQYQWQLFELPTPIVHSDVDGRLLPATYANFLIVNGAVIVPVYGCPEDARALRVVAEAFPGYKIVSVMCAALAEQHGSLHCSTMQLAEAALVSIEVN